MRKKFWLLYDIDILAFDWQEKVQDTYALHGRGFMLQVLESAYRFGLGAIAGGEAYHQISPTSASVM